MFWPIKNPKLALLALVFFCLFIELGQWQLRRAQEKQLLLNNFAERTHRPPLSASQLAAENDNDWRFYRATLVGHFDNHHTFLLDNKTFHGEVGYQIYTPFIVEGLATPILVNRGFIPLPQHKRSYLPAIKIANATHIIGILNLPPTYVALGSLTESAIPTWPLRVAYIHLTELSALLHTALFPYILTLPPEHPDAYALEWQILTMGPEKHRGYALQWFALALTLLILFVALNRAERKNT